MTRTLKLPAGQDTVLELDLGGATPANPPSVKGDTPCNEPLASSS
jgi:hypothetical protein